MQRKHSLSVIIIAMNESDRIRPCLESVQKLADEIVVLDSGSSDDTVAICQEFTDKVWITDWPGDGPQKQRALERATSEWVLRIDADERVSPELAREIETILARDRIQESAFKIPWNTYCFGRYLRHGSGKTYHINLFRREAAHYSPDVVHAKLYPAEGPIRKLKGVLYHDAARSFKHMLQKFVDYAWFSAGQKHAKGQKGGIGKGIAHAMVKFIKLYIVKGGFLEGERGLMMAIMHAQYTFNKYAALWTLSQPGLPSPDGWKPPR